MNQTKGFRFISAKSLRFLGISLVLAALSGCAAHPAPTPVPPSPIKDWTITPTWNYDFTNFVPCSATVTKGCVSGFTWGYLQGSTQIPLKTSPASVCSGATQPEVCTDTANALLGIGNVTPYVVANFVDNNGVANATAMDQGPLDTVAAGLATNLTWTRK